MDALDGAEAPAPTLLDLNVDILVTMSAQLDALECSALCATCTVLHQALKSTAEAAWEEAANHVSRRMRVSDRRQHSALARLEDYLENGPNAAPRRYVDWTNKSVTPVHCAVLLRALHRLCDRNDVRLLALGSSPELGDRAVVHLLVPALVAPTDAARPPPLGKLHELWLPSCGVGADGFAALLAAAARHATLAKLNLAGNPRVGDAALDALGGHLARSGDASRLQLNLASCGISDAGFAAFMMRLAEGDLSAGGARSRLPKKLDLRSNGIHELGLRALLLAASQSRSASPGRLSDAALRRALGPLGLAPPFDAGSIVLAANPCAKLPLYEEVYEVGPSVLAHLS